MHSGTTRNPKYYEVILNNIITYKVQIYCILDRLREFS